MPKTKKRCARSERKLTWNRIGPAGPAGSPGLPGTKGDAGLVTGAKIANTTITGGKLVNDTLTGTQINESTQSGVLHGNAAMSSPTRIGPGGSATLFTRYAGGDGCLARAQIFSAGPLP